jgi:hypothetical protein
MAHWLSDYLADVDAMRVDEWLARHTEDVVFRFGNQPPMVGKTAVREGVSGFFSGLAGLQHTFVEVWDEGDATILEHVATYTRPDGLVVDIPTTGIYRRRGDLVADVRVYSDMAPLFAAATS